MEEVKSGTYWSAYRANLKHADSVHGIKTIVALAEIEAAIREAFPAASEVTVRAELAEVSVKFTTGQKLISVRFGSETLDTYRRCSEAARHQALKTLRLVCNCAFAREYAPEDDPINPFVIDATMALTNTVTA